MVSRTYTLFLSRSFQILSSQHLSIQIRRIPKAFELALKLAKEKNADIVLATDPDADRLGIYALDTKTGRYMPFTGNMSGLIIAEYQFRERAKCGLMPKNPAMVKTIVTTNMADLWRQITM